MRCPDCQKFVSYGDAETSEIEVEINDTELAMNGTLYLTCGDCGTNLKSVELASETTIEEEVFPATPDSFDEENDIVEYEIDGTPDIEPTSRSETKDRKGKPIKSPRYWKTFYGASASIDVARVITDKDGNEKARDTTTFTIEAEEQASAFEECC